MQHANEAIDEVRRAEFFRKGGRMRGLVKGKRWLLLSLTFAAKPAFPAGRERIPSAVNTGDLNQGWVKT
jgi:hypothetical protein